jgi:AcrR family transcriptional regulator
MATSRKAGTRGVSRAVREEQILDVAGRVFAQRGYHAASMDEIAAGADITKPVVYAYFGSKERLYLAYIERAGRELLGRIQQADDPSAPPAARLRTGVIEFLTFVDERRDGWTVLQIEMSTQGGPLVDEVARARRRITKAIRLLLLETSTHVKEQAQAAAVDGVAHAFVGASEALANWWLANRVLSREEVADLLLALWDAGVQRTVKRARR